MTSENKSISTVLAVAACALSLAANADRHWTGGGETTDWSDTANWGAGDGNWVFGGAEVANLPDSDPIVCTFANLVEIANGVWVENETKPNVVWRVAENAVEGAGLKSDWGTNNSLNIGTGKHGGLTIESGVYYMPKQLWIGNGAVDSYFTLAGGVFTNNSYVCIGYGPHNRTATMTVTGGEFYEKNDKFIIGQGNHAGCVGVYNQTGGTVSVPELFMSENNGSSSLALSGGTFEVRSWGRVGMGANTVCDIAVSGGEFDTDGELVLGCGNNSKVDMTLSGGLFKPKKLWVGSRYDSDNMTFTTTGCDATVTVTDGTLTTDSGQDIVLGGRENANGTLTVEDGTVSCGRTLHVGWKGNGLLDVQGGAVSASAVSMGSDTTTATGTVHMTSGTLTSSGNVSIGMKGDGLFEMSGGTMKTSGEFWVGGEGNASSGNAGSGRLVMTGGSITNTNWTSIGRNGNGILELKGGLFEVTGNGLEIGRYNSSTGIVVVTGGTLKKSSSNQYLAVGQESDYGALILSNGVVSVKAQIQVAKGSRNTGYLSVSGGELTCNDLLQVGLNGNGTFEMDGGSASCTGLRLGTDNANAVGTANISGGSLVASGDIYVANGGTGTLNLKGGVLTGNKAMVGNGTGTLNLDGGTLQARQNNDTFIVDNERLTVNIGENGAVFDSAGYNVTVPATLSNADGLVGNGMIWKKGLGTLTISSDLDLARTFKFTINEGVGPIALTGTGNTLGEGAKISVAIDPVEVEMNTPYVLLTGLGESYTKEDNFDLPSNNGFYAYTWTLESGTLSVSLAYSENAPVTARYGSDAWKFYNGNNTLIENAEPLAWTTYIFTGVEPAGDLETIGVGHKVVLEAAKDSDVGVTNTFSVASVANAKDMTVTSEEGCAVRLQATEAAPLSAKTLTNNGTLILSGTISIPSLVIGGEGTLVAEEDATVSIGTTLAQNLVVADGAKVSVAKGQTLTKNVSGEGEFALSNGTYYGLRKSYMNGFSGVLELGPSTTFYPTLEGEQFMPGTGRIRMAGATMHVDSGYGVYFDCPFEIVKDTNNYVSSKDANMRIGKLTGEGYLRYASNNNRGPQLNGDNREFKGTCELVGTLSAPPTGFFGNHSGSDKASWLLTRDGHLYRDGLMTYTITVDDVNGDPVQFGVLKQTGPDAYIRIGNTSNTYRNGTKIEVGTISGGESVINGKFSVSTVSFTKVGADSWLTLGQGFAAVAGSTFNFSAGGICFNLPAGETEPTSLIDHTVTFDPSVKIRVAMTQSQFEALDLNEEYLVAKLPTNPGYKPETELLVDGTVLDTPAAARWGVRFKSFPAVGETPAYVGAVLRRKSSGLMIIFR